MKKTWSLIVVVAVAMAAVVAFANRAPATGESAPAFSASTASGKTVSLKDFEGRYVVLEWWNYGCPYVARHYGGNMQKLQEEFTKDGVVWLSMASSAPGKQGHVTAGQALEIMKEKKGTPTEIILDPEGVVGKSYKAMATPHMFLISPKGEVLYDGAIDNMPRGTAPAEGAINYIKQAYAEAKAGKEVSVKKTKPYGCSMKY